MSGTTIDSASEALIEPIGDVSKTSPEAVLRFCETYHFSGTLTFASGGGRGVLPMLNGVPEIEANDKILERALDEFLSLKSGSYTLSQLLPSLDGAVIDGALSIHGSLERLSPADLLRYCEAAGLTGTLTLEREKHSYVARYSRGELHSVTVNDDDAADLTTVFEWTDGLFEIVGRSVFDGERPTIAPKDNLLKTLELALTEIMDRSKKSAAPRATSVPPARAPSILRGSTLPFGVTGTSNISDRSPVAPAPPRPRSVVPPPSGPDPTVKIYFVDRGPPQGPSRTRHAAGNLGAEVISLEDSAVKSPSVPTIQPESAIAAVPSEPRRPPPRFSEPPASRAGQILTGTFGLVLVSVLAIAIYIMLALVR